MFTINGVEWSIRFVLPKSPFLMRDDGSFSIGMSDANTNTVYLSSKLHGAMLEKVLCHELTHCLMLSYKIEMPIEMEEWLCDFMANYGKTVIYLLDNILCGMKSRDVA